MKRTLFYLSITIVAAIVLSSCATGYSKSSYISSLEKFVGKVENNWKSYDEDDWTNADKKMKAFEEKYDKYSDDFTDNEIKDIVLLMARYKLTRAKATGKSWLKDIKGWFNDNKDFFDEALEDLKELGGSIEQFADSVNALFNQNF